MTVSYGNKILGPGGRLTKDHATVRLFNWLIAQSDAWDLIDLFDTYGDGAFNTVANPPWTPDNQTCGNPGTITSACIEVGDGLGYYRINGGTEFPDNEVQMRICSLTPRALGAARQSGGPAARVRPGGVGGAKGLYMAMPWYSTLASVPDRLSISRYYHPNVGCPPFTRLTDVDIGDWLVGQTVRVRVEGVSPTTITGFRGNSALSSTTDSSAELQGVAAGENGWGSGGTISTGGVAGMRLGLNSWRMRAI